MKIDTPFKVQIQKMTPYSREKQKLQKSSMGQAFLVSETLHVNG